MFAKHRFTGIFLRYEGSEIDVSGVFPRWQKNPEGWFELWPREPLLASSMEEAKSLFQPMLAQIEDGSRDAEFEKKPYQPPLVPQLVKEIEHPTHQARARIVQYPDGIYSVLYLVYAPNGHYFPASTPSVSSELENEWGVTYMEDEERQRLSTRADDIESAEEIAVRELNFLVSQGPVIKRR